MKRKIIIINNTDGGLFVFRGPLLKALIKEDFEVVVIVSRSSYIEKIKELGVKVYEIDFNNHSTFILDNFRIIKELYKIIKKEHPEIVHTFTHKPNILGTIAARLAKIDRIYIAVTGLGTLFTYNDLKTKILRLILKVQYKIIIRFTNNIFFQNPDDRNEFRKFLTIEKKEILVNGSGIDLEEFSLPSKSEITYQRKKLLSELNLQQDENLKLVIFPARALKEKGLFEFYEMAKFVSKLDNSYVFIHAGLIDRYSKYGVDLKTINKFSKDHSVNYIGFKDNLKDYLAAVDIVVLPSYREGTPRSLIEALAVDKFIITTNAPGCKETVINNWNGFLCETHDVNSLISCVLQYKGKVEKRSRIFCETKFDVKKIIDKTLESYER